MFAPKNILAPIDFSIYSYQALKTAVDIAGQYRAKIYLLHVIDKQITYLADDYSISGKIVQDVEKAMINRSKEKLQKEVDNITGGKDLEVDCDVSVGAPSEEILKKQSEKGIDLIVIASRGRTGVVSYLIGSVTDKVVKGSKCNVVVVKQQD